MIAGSCSLPYSMAQIPVPVPASSTRFAPSAALGDRASSPLSDSNHRLCVRSRSQTHQLADPATLCLDQGLTESVILPYVVGKVIFWST